MKEIMAMVIVATITYGIYKLFELFARRKERITLAERLGTSLLPEQLKGELDLTALSNAHTFTALKIGSLLVGMGLGILVGYLICAQTIPDYFGGNWSMTGGLAGMIYGASVLTMGGLGLLAAFIIELKLTRKDK